MFVVKRNEKIEAVQIDKIRKRIDQLLKKLNIVSICSSQIIYKVYEGLHDQISTKKIDVFMAEMAASMATIHPDFSRLAGAILVSNLHNNTLSSFSETIKVLYEKENSTCKKKNSVISQRLYNIAKKNATLLDKTIIHERDFSFDFFAIRTLLHGYLLCQGEKTIERPQYMYMRVALSIHPNDIDLAIESYHLMSQKWFTHATPTLFNAGRDRQQLASCFLLMTEDDSIEGIYNTLKKSAKISQFAGGIGLSIHNIRAKGSKINGTSGLSNGIVPMLRVFDMTARYVDQGGGKRKGAFAIYLPLWHADIFSFLQLRRNHGKEEMRTRDLSLGLWVSNLFMRRVEKNAKWSLFCPSNVINLGKTYGEQFEKLYIEYEKKGYARKVVPARKLWTEILISQIETGTPYILYKDSINKKSNQKNVGPIISSNLCTEIVQVTDRNEIAVCNLASISLPNFIKERAGKKFFDHKQLRKITAVVTRNLNCVIDETYYPLEEARRSNLRHRPIGIGVQGLADLFFHLRIPFDSPEARQLNKEIFETIYFSALETSNILACKYGTYETFANSPASQGLLQFDLWGKKVYTNRWSWKKLKESIKKNGLRNSLLIAPMPTASTSQILGNNECFEPYTYNIYLRRTISGEFIVVNRFLLNDLIKQNLWNDKMKNKILEHNGSVQNLPIPNDLKELYKTAWEIKQKVLIDMAADRSIYIDQSQSLNIFIKNPTFAKLTSMHFYGWQKGLKTGMYYLRSQSAYEPVKFTIDPSSIPKEEENSCIMCSA